MWLSLPGYNARVEHLTQSEYLGLEILPVPEPSTWTMLVAGAAVLGIAGRRRKQST